MSAPAPDQSPDQSAAPSASPTQPEPAPAPATNPSSAAPADAQKMNPGASPPQQNATDASSNMFSSWGFDVKAVTDNMGIGNLFAAPDAVDPDGVELTETGAPVSTGASVKRGADGGAGDEEGLDIAATADEIGAKAAHLASSATVELGHASKAAQETIGKAAEEIGRGWGNLNSFLDDMLAPDKAKGGASSAADPDDNLDVHAKFRQLFPDQPPDDEVVDHYRCVLLQKYRCYLNNATPEKTFPLRGRLFVTTAMIAMYVADDGGAFGGQNFGVAIPFQDVAKIQKGAKAMLRVVSKSQTSFIFADFESETHYSGALSLLEHMTGASAPLPVQTPGAEAEAEAATEPTSGETAVAD